MFTLGLNQWQGPDPLAAVCTQRAERYHECEALPGSGQSWLYSVTSQEEEDSWEEEMTLRAQSLCLTREDGQGLLNNT